MVLCLYIVVNAGFIKAKAAGPVAELQAYSA